MAVEKGSLTRAVEAFRRTLAGDASRNPEWAARIDQTLAALEQAVRQHRARLSDDEGRLVDVDNGRNPSPTVARRAHALEQELTALLEEAGRLRLKLRDVHPAGKTMDPSTAAGALPVAPEAAEVSDFGVFCERAEQLLQHFAHYQEEEAELIQESVTLDLGAGD